METSAEEENACRGEDSDSDLRLIVDAATHVSLGSPREGVTRYRRC